MVTQKLPRLGQNGTIDRMVDEIIATRVRVGMFHGYPGGYTGFVNDVLMGKDLGGLSSAEDEIRYIKSRPSEYLPWVAFIQNTSAEMWDSYIDFCGTFDGSQYLARYGFI